MEAEIEEKGCEISVLRVVKGNMESQLRQEIMINMSGGATEDKSYRSSANSGNEKHMFKR